MRLLRRGVRFVRKTKRVPDKCSVAPEQSCTYLDSVLDRGRKKTPRPSMEQSPPLKLAVAVVPRVDRSHNVTKETPLDAS